MNNKKLCKISRILSLRNIKHEVFRDIVYEWEDEISEITGLKIESINRIKVYDGKEAFLMKCFRHEAKYRKQRLLNYISPIDLAFVTVTNDVIYFNGNCVFVFVDLWPIDYQMVCKKMKHASLFFVTCLDTYHNLKQMDSNLNVEYLPLSVPSKYILKKQIDKQIDIVQVGRRHKILHNFAIQYTKENPQVEYVYTDVGGAVGSLQYYSTKNGLIGQLTTRTDYINLLKNSKISLVASPGADNEKSLSVGVDFPTPRFYESAANYCILLSRYNDNDEFRRQKIGEVAVRVNTYEEFKYIMDNIIRENYTLCEEKYKAFNQLHSTETWVKGLNNQLRKYNLEVM